MGTRTNPTDGDGEANSRVAVCQFQPVVGDPEANYQHVDSLLAGLDDAVELAVFPELCVTGYDLDAAAEHAAPVPGPLTDPLGDVAARHDTSLVVGVPERTDDGLYNDLVLVDADGVQAVYRKQYLWGDEASVFDSGDEAVVADTAVGTVGFLVCYDLNFPEVALAYADLDCDVLAVSAAWRTTYRADWRLLLRARALDGPCYAIGANHCGEQSGRQHAGTSLVAGPLGDVHAVAGTEEDAVSAPIDGTELRDARDRTPVRETRERRRGYFDG